MTDASLFDPLTGAYSRATFSEHLRTQLERSQREQVSCSLIFFDLDHFKSINDAFGHARGDEALVEVARRVRETIRTSDLFFRYGGDEFVLILPDTPKTEAVHLANRLLESIRAHPIGGDSSITLSISVGVATFPEDTAVEHALFEKADARNYEAKRRGRARVISDESSAVTELPFVELSRIIERDEALETAQEFLTAISERQHGILSVIGVSGVGRSRFLVEVEKRARLQGFEVLALRSSPRLKNRPYGILTHELSQIFLPSTERVSLEDLDSALKGYLTSSGRDQILISVDDMSNLDWGTLDLLRQLLLYSSLPALGLVAITDPDTARVAVPFWSPVSEQITLRPLSANGLRIWLRVLMQWEPPEDFMQWLEKETHGLPHDVERLIKYLMKHNALIKDVSGWSISDNYKTIGAEGIRQWHRHASPNNLPAALTSFVGRETELKDVRQFLAATRLLTVVGPGGMGKTRLTLQVARETLSSFKDGVWLIELAPISDPALALYTIASVLRVHEEQSRPLLETLSVWLRDKELLFILDNCEHLIEFCAQFAHDVLQASPNVRILASSREALDISGELVYRMPAMESPSIEIDLPIEQLSRFPAARLFIERAAFAQSTFNVGVDEAPMIAQICRQLDGIPLALELAAARLRSLSLEEIAAGLNDRFSLLTKGNRGAMRRHQTLRALIDWSYDMLSEEEQILLRQLSVFSGGWTLEAAKQVYVQNRSSEVESITVAELLQRLAKKSLISFAEHGEEPWYSILETIRQYAREKLIESNEEEEIPDRHLNYFLALAEDTEKILISAARNTCIQRLELEHDNLRAALERGCTRDTERALQLTGSLGWFWYFADHLNEGYAWCLRALALDEKTMTQRARAKALNAAGIVSGNLGHNEESRNWLEQSAALWELLGDDRRFTETLFWLAYSLVQLGEDEHACLLFEKHEESLRTAADPLILAWSLSYWGRALENARGDYGRAKTLHDAATAMGTALHDINILGTAFMNLGYWAAKQGDYESAYRYHLESSKWHKADGARLRIAISSHNMADMLSLQGKYQEAQALYEESLALSRALGDQAFIAWTAYRLGYLFIYLKEYRQALELFTESLTLYRKQTEQELITSPLAGCAELHRAQGRLIQATRLLSFVTQHPQSASRLFLLAIDAREYDHSLMLIRNQLSESDFNAAWETGKNLTLDEATRQGLKTLEEL